MAVPSWSEAPGEQLEEIDRKRCLIIAGTFIAAYATYNATPQVRFSLMVFKNIRRSCLGSDDFPPGAKVAITRDLTDALQAG